jgi:hypothetical protein
MQPDMKPVPAIRAASILSYLTGIGTLLAVGPGLAFDLATGTSLGSRFGMNPSYGDYLHSNPIGGLWGFWGALVFGAGFLVVAALQPVAGYWLGRSLKRGGRLGAVLAVCVTAFGLGFVLPAWVPVGPVILILLASAWNTLR